MLAAGLAAGLAGPAAAHTGQGPIAVLQAGPYTVEPFDAARGDSAELQRYPFTVFDAPNHKATDVKVTVSARDEAGTQTAGPIDAVPAANGFAAQLPPAPAAGWDVTVIVTGPKGTGQTKYFAHPIQQASATSGSSLVIKGIISAFGLTILAAVLYIISRGRKARPDDAPRHRASG